MGNRAPTQYWILKLSLNSMFFLNWVDTKYPFSKLSFVLNISFRNRAWTQYSGVYILPGNNFFPPPPRRRNWGHFGGRGNLGWNMRYKALFYSHMYIENRENPKTRKREGKNVYHNFFPNISWDSISPGRGGVKYIPLSILSLFFYFIFFTTTKKSQEA